MFIYISALKYCHNFLSYQHFDKVKYRSCEIIADSGLDAWCAGVRN